MSVAKRVLHVEDRLHLDCKHNGPVVQKVVRFMSNLKYIALIDDTICDYQHVSTAALVRWCDVICRRYGDSRRI